MQEVNRLLHKALLVCLFCDKQSSSHFSVMWRAAMQQQACLVIIQQQASMP
jgi:hypothetical protein